jgi:hypothetical protein
MVIALAFLMNSEASAASPAQPCGTTGTNLDHENGVPTTDLGSSSMTVYLGRPAKPNHQSAEVQIEDELTGCQPERAVVPPPYEIKAVTKVLVKETSWGDFLTKDDVLRTVKMKGAPSKASEVYVEAALGQFKFPGSKVEGTFLLVVRQAHPGFLPIYDDIGHRNSLPDWVSALYC